MRRSVALVFVGLSLSAGALIWMRNAPHDALPRAETAGRPADGETSNGIRFLLRLARGADGVGNTAAAARARDLMARLEAHGDEPIRAAFLNASVFRIEGSEADGSERRLPVMFLERPGLVTAIRFRCGGQSIDVPVPPGRPDPFSPRLQIVARSLRVDDLPKWVADVSPAAPSEACLVAESGEVLDTFVVSRRD